MFGRLTFFMLGGVTALVAKQPLRNALKGAMVGAYKATSTLKEIAEEIREDMEDAKSTAAASKNNGTRS